MRLSTQPSPASPGYGSLWWSRDAGTFRASGIFGQGIYVNPEENVVIALESARDVASRPGDWRLQRALHVAINVALGG